MTDKVELLAPAGSWESFIAAINNGADAIYLGGKNFSARAFANNFSHDELKKAVEYAHLLNVKIYVTLNTLITDFEFENVKKEVDFLYSIKVDALIIQDLGVYYYIKNKYPDFELHASTQMHVHNLNGVINCKKLGFKRVVLARESSLDFIKEACKQNIEIETFVHGAICVSYSGQCLMSSATKSRSANKGMCAQCCRLAYKICKKSDNQIIDTNTEYLLSPKDMMLINEIPNLINAGVKSFKIEGRMKSPAYVGYITRVYRKAIDSYLEGKKYNITENELLNMKYLFNRNFTNSYLLNDNKNIFGQEKPNHLGVMIGKVKRKLKDSILIELCKDLNQYDGIRIVSGNKEYGQIVNFISLNGRYVNKVCAGNICEIKCKDNIKYNDIVYKTIDSNLENVIKNTPNKKININIKIDIKANENIKIQCFNDYFNFNYISEIIAQEALKAPVDKDNFLKHFSLSETVYNIDSFIYNAENIFVPVKLINNLKHDFFNKLNEYRIGNFKREAINSSVILSEKINNSNELVINVSSLKILNPVVNNQCKYEISDNNLITEIGGLLLECDNKIASYTLNIANSYAYEFLLRIGFKSIILSSELNNEEILKLTSCFKSRVNININPIILSNTKRTLMYLNRNPFIEYVNDLDNYYLTDGNNEYQLINNGNIIEISESNFFEKKPILKGFKYICIK